jgi:nucleoside-diphosphate-sugar epimerase
VLAQRLPDEIRILLDGEDAMGIVTLSFSARPPLHFLRIYGTGGMVEVDFAQQKVRCTFANVFQLRRGRLKPCHGLMTLIHAFYDSIRLGSPTPVSRERALDVVATMDMVFEQLKYDPLRHEKLVPVLATAPTRPRVLVTGGTGFLGRALVRRLVAAGHAVRVLVRKLANADMVHGMGAEVVWGDIADMESFGAAMNGCDLVVHLAAGTSGSDKDSQTATLQGTRNLLELCRRYAPTRLVYISSCSVYAVADYKTGASVVETSSLERLPEQRGRYAASKLEAERYVREFIASSGVPTVILRPGAIYGPGGDLYTGMMGFSVGSQYIVIGKGDFVLPVVYVENLVDAIMLSLQKDEAAGQIFNVVDSEKLDKRTYMNRVIRRVDSKARVLYFPYWLLYSLTWMQERALRVMKRRPVLSCYRLVSSQRSVLYDSRRIVERLGWRAGVNVSEAIDRLVDSELARQRKVDGSVQGVPSDLLQSVVAHGPSAVDSAQ